MQHPTYHSTCLPRLCVLLANTGGGHRSVALSLAEAAEGRAKVHLLDLLDDHAPFPWKWMAAAYGPWTEYAPWLWRAAYRFGARRSRVELLERVAYPAARARVREPLFENASDCVISVHPLQTGVPLRILREAGRRTAFVTVVIDPVSPPAAWFCRGVDLCIVATEQARAAALAHGMPPEKVRVVGLPVRKAFSAAAAMNRLEARRQLGFDAERPLVLLSGGGAGLGRLLELARAVAARAVRSGLSVQLAVLAGNNKRLCRALEAEPWPIPVRVSGFVRDPEVWMAAADLLMTKAGPSTLAEAACVGLPVIITGFVPGQETGNAAWVEAHGAGVYAGTSDDAAATAVRWLQAGAEALATRAANARAMARPCAADEVIAAVMGLLGAEARA